MSIFSRKKKQVSKLLPLSYLGHPSLRKQSVDIEEITDEIRQLAGDMTVTMYENDGQGLAAPQVGVNLNMVALDVMMPRLDDPPATTPGELSMLPRMPLILVNPLVTDFSAETEVGVEGCLSLPEMSAPVERSIYVQLTFKTLEGRTESYRCGGMLARCLQHEIDHLNGIVYPDRVAEEDVELIRPKMDRLEKRTKKRLGIREK
jgi:peptide deformylase